MQSSSSTSTITATTAPASSYPSTHLKPASECSVNKPQIDWNKYQSADCYARWAYEIPKYMKMGKLKVGDTVSMLNQKGEWESYYFLPMHSNHRGLSGIIYIPKNYNQDGVEPEIIVTFRGTIFSDADSVQRNLEVGGPGFKSFSGSKDNFLQDIEAAITIFYPDAPAVKIQIVGHSLGGADAQFLTLAIIDKILTDPNYAKISSIDLMVHNSVGVSHEVVEQGKVLLERLDAHPQKIDISVHYGMVAGDGLQQFGENMIFNDAPADKVKVDVLKVHSPYEGQWSSTKNLFEFYAGFFGTIKTHSQAHFGGKLTPEDEWEPANEYLYLSNDNPHDIPKIQDELLTKSEYVTKFWVQSIKNTLHALLDWMSPWMEISSEAPTIVHHDQWQTVKDSDNVEPVVVQSEGQPDDLVLVPVHPLPEVSETLF